MNLIAHRCNNKRGFYENSLFACKDVLLEDYISGIEIDIRLSSDKVLVVSHNNLVKTYNGKIININKTKYKNLKKYNIGNSKNVVRITSLDTFLSSVNTNKKIIIEIKDNNLDVVDILYDVIKKYKFNFYICSFHYDVVNLFKNKYSNIKVGLIIGYMFNIDKIYNKFDFNLLHYNLINRINYKKEIFIWTVNNKKIFKKINNKLKNYSNIYVISDVPYLLK